MPIIVPSNLVDVSQFPGLHIDLRYSGPNNFLGTAVYGELNRCYLHSLAAKKLQIALEELAKHHPGYKLVAFDCWRPPEAQEKMWALVQGTSKEKYVANPKRGSMHSFGLAIDVGLMDAQGDILDMGTAFDHFGPESGMDQEADFLKQGILTKKHLDHRRLLRDVMQVAGMRPLAHEWWHYDAVPREQAQSIFSL